MQRDLVEHLGRRLPATGRRVIHDLGCGTGAMGRWLAPLLPGPQHWVVHDRDAELLAVAAAELPGPAADGAAVTVEAKQSDITRLQPDDLAGATLITASALLDLLTGDELAGLVAVCAGAGCPVLLTLSVVGRVELIPADPLDARVAAAFDAHQRRATSAAACSARTPSRSPSRGSAGWAPRSSSGPARGDSAPAEAELAAEWFTGWVGAACEQQTELAAETGAYARRRLAEAAAGRLAVTVDHADLLVLPSSVRCGRPDEPDAVDVGPPRGRRRDARRPGLAPGHGPIPRRRPHGRRPGAGGSGGHRAADHRVLCLAVEDRRPRSRHRPALPAAVAAYYRSQFLNITLPGGVVGDVHRGVRHGRDGRRRPRVAGRRWERSAGQVVQVVLTVVVLLALPSPVRSSMPLVAIAARRRGARRRALSRARPAGGRSRWARAERVAGDIRDGLLARRAWPASRSLSLVVAGHTATFLIAARTAGITASLSRMLPLALLVMLAMVLPSVAGWGPREGATAWGSARPGWVRTGVATAVVYGVMVLVASLPGAAVLVVAWFRRTRLGAPEPPLLRVRSPCGRKEHAHA